MRALSHVLIANRGEIAVRVLRTLRARGYRSTVVYSDADADSPAVALADHAVHIGPAEASRSYLDVARIVAAAHAVGADAVHPGYGFLSENAAFARACRDAGLVFIGPSPEAIELMGDKRHARRAMAAVGVPCVPGYDGPEQSDAELLAQAKRIGFPIIVPRPLAGVAACGASRARPTF